MRKIIKITVIFLLLNICIITGFANSAQTSWNGRTAENVIITGEDCPLVVEKEVLTFDIHSFPPLHASLEDMAEYDASVTAEYTFYNPADYDVTATLVFPFGKMPYGNYSEQKVICPDKDKYSVYVDGKKTDNRVKYTYSAEKEFDIYREMKKLTDGYIEDVFYQPDTAVKKYVYRATGYGKGKSPYRDIGLTWVNRNNETALLTKHYSSFYTKDKNIAVITVSASENEDIVFYTIGKELEETLQLEVYYDKSPDENIQVEYVGAEKMNLEDFLLKEWCPYDEQYGVSKIEWYNLFVTAFRENINEDVNIIGNYNYIEQMADDIMGWFVYKITLPAGKRVVNTVVAPVYPAINAEYNPAVYTYEYLLSPAKTWAEFKEIEIFINTDSYLISSKPSPFGDTDIGYKYRLMELPQGELRFSLCSEQEPSHPGNTMSVKPNSFAKGIIITVIIVLFYLRDIFTPKIENKE